MCADWSSLTPSATTTTTPQVQLSVNSDVKAARIVKGRLEKTMLGQVARHIKLVLRPGALGGRGGG